MQDPRITYFPVGNGDCSLIALSDNVQILIDCNFTDDSRDDEEEARYDVHAHLLRYGKKLNSTIPHVDVFILTHADLDHCRGFDTTFYTGDPRRYSRAHLNRGLLIADELWFTPRIFRPYEGKLCDPAKVFCAEARRRMELHRARHPDRYAAGNRIRIIGYSDNPDHQGLEHLVSVPGTYITMIDNRERSDFRFFVHAPFRIDTDDRWAERNDTSVVLQAQFDVGQFRGAGLALFGGDAGAAIWEKILERSEEDTLKWDLLLAPHHCSWTFFSELPYKENKVPAKASLRLLEIGMPNARTVASCKPIRDDDDNPPHFAAKRLYERAVGADRFFVTSETPNERRPLPIQFAMSENGPVLEEAVAASAVASSAAVKPAVSTPQTYGRR